VTWEALSRSAGIKEGLTITPKAEAKQVEVTPGSAVDGQGRRINLTSTQSVDLSGYQDQTVYLVIFYGEEPSGPTVQAIPEAEASEYPAKTYLRLARLVIDSEGRISESVKSELKDGKVTIENMPAPIPRTLNGLEAGWLQARLDTSLPSTRIRQDLTPSIARSGESELDLRQPFYPFGTDESPPPSFELYLEPILRSIPDDLWQLGRTTVTLNLSVTKPGNALADLVLTWEYFKGNDEWEEMGRSTRDQVSSDKDTYGFSDGTQAFTQTGLVSFQVPTDIPDEELHGFPGRWLRVRIRQGSYGTGHNLKRPRVGSVRVGYEWTLPQWALPQIEKITAQVHVERSGLAPDLALANSVPLDLSKDFYPFGERPQFNDSFYLASQEVFAKPGATVTIKVTKTVCPPITPTSRDLEIKWEVWTETGWQELTIETKSFEEQDFENSSADSPTDVAKFLESGDIRFTLPDQTGPGTVNGETNYWLRVRISGGSYEIPGGAMAALVDAEGEPIETETENGTPDLIYVELPPTPTPAPPSLESLTLSYTYDAAPGPLAACKTYNDFTYEDHTQTAAEANDTAFTPFKPSEDTQPALYLGFDRPFANRPMTLYARVDPLQPGESVERVTAEPARVIWEYAGPDEGWHHLGAQDETNAFRQSGLIQLIGPQDFTQRQLFGHALYWLRARWEHGEFPVPPRLQRLLTNTTWATQATTIQNETLGSSTGQPNQVFRTTQAPLLLGQRLEVRELEVPSPAERATIAALEGEDAITVILDDAGRPEEVWVRWHAVPDFHGSDPRDRHYLLDHVRGEVRFGDGRHGMVPPTGRNNIRMALYRAGGGPQGNRPAETITQLKTTVPYVDSVTHLEAAHGGAEQESLAEVKEREPRALRHRDRAVTAQDIEDLAHEASPDVARARAITPHFDPIALEWLPAYRLPLDGPGQIKVEAKWEDDQRLAIRINGPGQGTPYAQQEGPSPLTVAYTVTPEQFQPGDVWRVTIANLNDAPVRAGTLQITFPVGSLHPSLDVPANDAHDVGDAGRVELIIVPHSMARQPTPSLALIQRVEDYILNRCAPTVDLWVTEPDWVEVTVAAQVVPVSWQAADAVAAAVVAELERFLHPLSGGPEGRGWPFGRRPHLSDLYALLESIEGVDHVRSLSVVSVPSLAEEDEDDPTKTTLPRDSWDRFLIYSGRHQISVAPSLDSPYGGV
ncbi:MAG: baseplate J/gp47 family protein, partial [Anaerolineae bacterium]